MMIDATELRVLMLVSVTLTLIQGHGDARKQKLLWKLSRKMLMHLNKIWHAARICYSYELQTNSVSSD